MRWLPLPHCPYSSCPRRCVAAHPTTALSLMPQHQRFPPLLPGAGLQASKCPSRLTLRGAIPQLPDNMANDGIPVPSLRRPSERPSVPVLIAIDKDMKCTCVIKMKQSTHRPPRYDRFEREALLANFSACDGQGFATAQIQLRKLFFRYGITEEVASVTLHPRNRDPQEFSLVLYKYRTSGSEAIVPHIVATLFIDVDAVYLSAVQFFTAETLVSEAESCAESPHKQPDAIVPGEPDNVRCLKGDGNNSRNRTSARPGNRAWRQEMHKHRLPAIIDFQSVLPKCTVLIRDKLWILETKGVLKVWDLVRRRPQSRQSTLVIVPGDGSGRGGLLAIVNLLELLASRSV